MNSTLGRNKVSKGSVKEVNPIVPSNPGVSKKKEVSPSIFTDTKPIVSSSGKEKAASVHASDNTARNTSSKTTDVAPSSDGGKRMKVVHSDGFALNYVDTPPGPQGDLFGSPSYTNFHKTFDLLTPNVNFSSDQLDDMTGNQLAHFDNSLPYQLPPTNFSNFGCKRKLSLDDDFLSICPDRNALDLNP